jgi:transcriptional regulator with XRE-family HTH domain
MSNLAKLIGLELKRRREGAGLSQHTLGAMVGLTPVSLSRIESGIQNAPLSTLSRIAEQLDCRIKISVEPIRGDAIENGNEVAMLR